MPFSVKNRSQSSNLAEINVTPLVDVILVLLIIFMVSAPLMQQGITVDLPKTNSGTLTEVPDQIIITISRTREIALNGENIPKGSLKTKLQSMVSVKPEIQVVIQAEQSLPYGLIAHVLSEAKKAKVKRVGLATELGESKYRL